MTPRPRLLIVAIFAIGIVSAADSDTLPETPGTPAEAPPSETRPKSDETVEAAVARELDNDPRVHAMKIKVAVREGVVTLTGTATSVDEKDNAEAVVRRVHGVRDVENRLAVEVPGEPPPGASMIPEIPAAR